MPAEPSVETVNLAVPAPNPYKSAVTTGFGKTPVDGPVEVRAPGPKHGGRGSGLVGDHVGDRAHHGGDDQAVYAFAREDLARWELRLGRELPGGAFGENLTTRGLDLAAARVGERWRVGSTVELVVTCPRVPCSTFRGRLGVTGWLPMFTADAHPGAYLAVAVPGHVRAGDRVEVLHRPDHGVDLQLYFRVLMGARDLLPALLPAAADLPVETREELVAAGLLPAGA